MNKKNLFVLAILMLSCVNCIAQKMFDISGSVVDKATGEAVISATVQVMSLPDSTFVAGTTSGLQGEFSLQNVKKGAYVLKISYIGYVSKYIDIDLNSQSKKAVDVGYITMEEDAVQLQDVEVVAHVAKVAVKGDSLVYNAASYRMPEGSTLEALVRQLPGAKVDKEGNITINGKTVSKILVDGKEFFLNDKSVAMKNIPTEMIDKLKTYDRKSDLSRLTGIDDGEEETVLDLTVKKGMKNGWYGNVDLGAGTRHRYSERFNVNRFRDDFQFTLLGNANNVSDMGFGGGGGRWGWGESGLRSSKELGGNFATAKPKLETGGSIRYRYDGSDNENNSSTEYFNAALARFNDDYSKNMTGNHRLSGNFRFEWKPDTMTNIILRPDFTYSRDRGRSHSTAASFNADPNDTLLNRLDDIILNRNASRSQSYSTSTNFNGELQANRKFNDKGRNLTLRLVGNYNDGVSRQLSAASIIYKSTDANVQNNRYYNTPTRNYGMLSQLTYSEPVADRTYLQFSYTYDYNYSHNDRRAYIYDSDAYQSLLQSMENQRYNINAVLRFMDEMKYVLDGTDSIANRLSQFSEYRRYNQTANLSFRKVHDKYNISVGLDFMPQRTTLNYKYMGQDYPEITRSVFNIAPRVNMRLNFDRHTNLHVVYNGRTRQPSMTNLLDIKDDSNPLAITKGNPGLKPSFSHNVFGDFNAYNAEKQRGIYSWFWMNVTRNSIDQKTTFDNATGVRTTMPMNINGNWNGGIGFGFNTGLGKKKLFSIDVDLGGDYSRRVGFYSNDDGDADLKSVTHSTTFNPGFNFSYRKDMFSATINGRLDYTHSKNHLNPTENMRTYDFSYGAEFKWSAPWGTSLSSDIGINSRRGYSSSEMNTNELLWNAQVSHSFFRGRALTIMLEVNDILGQQTNISRTISALMRTDSRHNAIYQYCMLRVIYRFNILGGKNNLSAPEEHDEWDGDWGDFGDWDGGW